MGWASGSGLLGEIVQTLKERRFKISSKTRRKIYLELIESFRGYDCDTIDEVLGEDKAFDEAYYEACPEYVVLTCEKCGEEYTVGDEVCYYCPVSS